MTSTKQTRPEARDLLCSNGAAGRSAAIDLREDNDVPTFSQRASLMRRIARAEVADDVAAIRERARRELAEAEAARQAELVRERARLRASVKRNTVLSVVTGAAAMVMAAVLCINVGAATLNVDADSELGPTVNYQLGDWAQWTGGGTMAAVPDSDSDSPGSTPEPSSPSRGAAPSAGDERPVAVHNCGDPNDPLNSCL